MITNSYFRGSKGTLIVYDITNEESFLSTKKWLEDTREKCAPNIVIILVGNKADKPYIERKI